VGMHWLIKPARGCFGLRSTQAQRSIEAWSFLFASNRCERIISRGLEACEHIDLTKPASSAVPVAVAAIGTRQCDDIGCHPL